MKNLFFTAIIILFAIGCSAGRIDPTQPELLSSSDSIKVTRLAGSPSVYQTDIPAKAPIYATTIKECGINDQTPNQSLARELFVGFDNPRIIAQAGKSLSSKEFLFTCAQAQLDSEPVSISVYSLREDDCVTDILFWSAIAEPLPNEPIEQFITEIAS